jgi:hypothetical protein
MHRKFKPNPPVPEQSLRTMANGLAKGIPSAYLNALTIANGGEGFVGNRYVRLRPVENILQLNRRYHVAEFAPAYG